MKPVYESFLISLCLVQILTHCFISSVSDLTGLNIERVITIRGSIEGMVKAGSLIYNKLKTSYEQDLQVRGLIEIDPSQLQKLSLEISLLPCFGFG